jgi:hypothetical protein
MQPPTTARTAPVMQIATPQAVEAPTPVSTGAEPLSVDQEVLDWKQARGSQFNIPWRQVYLMASLCFGVASFVLPDSVNDNVDYLLWGLCAMSAYAWFTGRKKKPATDSAAP